MICSVDIETVPNEFWANELPALETLKTAKQSLEDAERERIKQMSLEPNFGMIVSIACANDNAQFVEGATSAAEEANLLKKFWETVAEPQTKIVTFCGKDFDIPYILRRSWYLAIEPTQDFDMNPYHKTGNHYDIYSLLHHGGHQEKKKMIGVKQGLAFYARRVLHVTMPDEKPIYELFKAGNMAEIKRLNLEDAVATWKLFIEMRGYYHDEIVGVTDPI